MNMKLNIRVTPKAKRNVIKHVHDAQYKIWVTAAPEQGKATAAAIKLLAKQLNVAPSLLTVVSGSTSRNKVVEVLFD